MKIDASKKQFDLFLSNKEMQSEFDRRMTKALETAQLRWKLEQNKMIQEILEKQSELLKKHQSIVEAKTRSLCEQEMASKRHELETRLEIARQNLSDEVYALVWDEDMKLVTQKILLLKKILGKTVEE